MSNTTRITALESDVRSIKADQARMLQLLEAQFGDGKTTAAPRTRSTTRKAKATKAKATRKASTKRTTTAKAEGSRFLSQPNRKAFIAAHDWAEPHTSTRELARLVVVEDQPLSKGWVVGEGYRAMFAEQAPAKAKGKKAGKKGGKKAKRTVAKVEASAPAKVRAAEGPRDALGHITPKSEWALRESLAETGKFDRKEIDSIVESQR